MDEIEFNGAKISLNADGSISAEAKSGAVVNMDKAGNITLNLTSIKSVGIENIVELKSHRVLRDGDLTVHQIQFIDGGEAKLAYRSSGELVEFSCDKMGISATPDNRVTLRQYTTAKKEHD